jgi:hypothetical protein
VLAFVESYAVPGSGSRIGAALRNRREHSRVGADYCTAKRKQARVWSRLPLLPLVPKQKRLYEARLPANDNVSGANWIIDGGLIQTM